VYTNTSMSIPIIRGDRDKTKFLCSLDLSIKMMMSFF